MTQIALPTEAGARPPLAKGFRGVVRFIRGNPSLAGGLTVIIGMIVVSVLIVLTSPYTTTQINTDAFALPSRDHLLGTDNLARDNALRLSHAALLGLWISFCATALGAVGGTLLGTVAGFAGGQVDNIIMRFIDVMLSIPSLLLALVLRVMLGPGTFTLIVSLAVISVPAFARIMRAPIITIKERDFVTAARIAGVNRVKIAFRHLLPNALTPLLVQFAATASVAVLLESVLSFLGAGILPPDPSAGRMISDSIRFMQRDMLLVLLPSLVLVMMTIGWNLIADGLQTAMSPRKSDLQIETDKKRKIVVRPPAQRDTHRAVDSTTEEGAA